MKLNFVFLSTCTHTYTVCYVCVPVCGVQYVLINVSKARKRKWLIILMISAIASVCSVNSVLAWDQ